MLTKTQIKILEIFVSRIIERFSIKQISEILNKPYPLIHRSIAPLISREIILKDDKGYLYLNYKKNFTLFSYIESLRKDNFIKNNKILGLFFNDILNKLNLDFFILLVFGSSVVSNNPKDLDLIFISEDESKINHLEKQIINISKDYTKEFDINVISIKSVYEMLSKRDSINILNESLNNHIIIYGGEFFYKILKNAR
ncbi:MAG: hypothetical protein WC867_03600 [Candidatus Pacearchaeota archaeon]|jgi:hypothetical protein